MDAQVVETTVHSSLFADKLNKGFLSFVTEDQASDWVVTVRVWQYVSSKTFCGWAITVHHAGELVSSTPRFDQNTDPFSRKVKREFRKAIRRAVKLL